MTNLKTSIRNARLTIVGTLGYWMAVGSLRSFVSLRLDEIGASIALLGIAIAVSPLAGMLFAIPCGRLIDRVGARRIAVAGALSMGVLGFGYAIADTITFILVLQLLGGVAEMALWVALQALITMDRVTGNARHLAIFSTMWGLGATTGPLVGAFLLQQFTFVGLSVFYSIMSFVSVAVHWIREAPVESGPSAPPRARIRSIIGGFLSDPGVRGVLVASFIVQFVVGARQSYYPVYLQEQGLSIPMIGALISLYSLVSLLVRPVTPRLIGWRPAGWLMLVSVWVSLIGLGITAIPLVPVLVLGAVLMGAGMGMNTILGVHEMAASTQPETRGVAMAMRMFVNRFGHFSQPLVFAVLVAFVGIGGAFAAGAAVLAVGAVFNARDLRHPAAPDKKGADPSGPDNPEPPGPHETGGFQATPDPDGA